VTLAVSASRPLTGLDSDVAAQSQLPEAGDCLLEGRHAFGKVCCRSLGNQAVDTRGPLERGIVHHDRHGIGRQLDVDFDPLGTALAGLAEGFEGVFGGIRGSPAMPDDFRQLQHSPIQS